MQHSTELIKQASHYRAVRDRLFNPVKVKATPIEKMVEAEPPKTRPQIFLVRDFDAHVIAWRSWLAFKEAISATSTSATINASFGEYANSAAIILADNADAIVIRRPMKDICLEVLQDFPGVTFEEVRGRHRQRNIVAARQACMYAIYTERKDISFPRLGHFFGGRDHTTALHAVQKIRAQREKESA